MHFITCASLLNLLTTTTIVSPLLLHILQSGFCWVINMKSHIICSQTLFLDATYWDLSTYKCLQISFCHPPPSSIPNNTDLFSHILSMHSFVLPLIPCLLCFIHLYSFGSIHNLRDVNYITISNFPEEFLLTISHIPAQVLPFSPQAALTTDQASSSPLSWYVYSGNITSWV